MKKKNARFYAALWGAKGMIGVFRLLGKNGTHVPGRKAINFCGDFLDMIDKPDYIIAVTGTNGKTTVANLIADVLQDQGYEFMENRFGGNIDSGIASALIKNSSLFGHMGKKLAVLEVDERMTTKIFPYVQPDLLVVTNLFRDSYRRNAHTDFISGILNKTIPSKTKLILNGEDLISNHLAPDNDRVYFGIDCEDIETNNTDNIIQDMTACPKCGSLIDFKYRRYNHIGIGHCPNCDFGSPDLDYCVTKVDMEKGRVYIAHGPETAELKLLGRNITDVYNAVTAYALLREFGIASEKICASFEKMHIEESRFKTIKVGDKEIVETLAKGQNPIACSRICDYIAHEPGKKAVVLMLDDAFDRKETSENIAWFFDTDMEFLKDDSITQIVVGGLRQHDMTLRLLMAGIPKEKIISCDSEYDCADKVDLSVCDTIHVTRDMYLADEAAACVKTLIGRIEKECGK